MADKAYDQNVRTQIEKRLTIAVMAWNDGDLDGYMDVYLKSEFVTLIPDEGHLWGIEKIRKHYMEQVGKNSMLSFHIVEVIPLGTKDGAEYAFVSGHFLVVNESPNEVRGNFTLLMIRFNDGPWYVFKDHSA